jgi:two-component system, OmpR family, KDP operon response regulator KdpE
MAEHTPTVLVIDDEVQVRRLLRAALEGSGWRVLEAEGGQLGISEVALARPDVIILDLGLPDMDGIDVLRRIREWSRVPILIASMREQTDEKIRALNAGADDYVTKPFNSEELVARLHAILRRGDPAGHAPEFAAGGLRVDFVSRTVRVGEEEIRLTPIEYTLIRILALNAGKVVTAAHLLREVWGPSGQEHDNYLRVHMTHLRRKLSDAGFERRRLRTEPGVGYRLLE